MDPTYPQMPGVKKSTLGKDIIDVINRKKGMTHEALFDLTAQEKLDQIFRVKSGTFEGNWKEISGVLDKHNVNITRDEFAQRYRSAVEWRPQSATREASREATRSGANRLYALEKTLSEKIATSRVAAKTTARAVAQQPETLRKIYSRAGAEISDAWRTTYKPWFNKHPKLHAAAVVLAGMTIADAAMPERQARLKGVRDPDDSPYLEVDGISFGPCGRGVARALTDFGSGRRFGNPVTRGFNELAAYRASLDIRYPDIEGVDFKSLEKSHETWTSAMMSANRRLFHRGEYDMARGSWLKTAGLNRSAWMGVVDLKNYHVKVSDADSITVKRRGLMNMFKKPVSIRLAGIDAPEVEHPGMSGRIAEDQFAGKQGAEYFEHLIERQQSLRLVFDPSSRSYNRHVGVLIGDRRANLNLQLVRGGAASALPWQSRKRQIVDHNAYAQAEALAASGKIGMWQSKGWQMHRAMGIIAGKRVTNTTLTSLDRVTRSEALSRWYGVVQRAHDSSRSPWTPDEVQDMYQVGSAFRAETMGRLNKRTKNVGFLPGIRGPVTPWSIVGSGINPNRMRGGNVSDFSSGRSKLTAVQEAVNNQLLEASSRGRPIQPSPGLAGSWFDEYTKGLKSRNVRAGDLFYKIGRSPARTEMLELLKATWSENQLLRTPMQVENLSKAVAEVKPWIGQIQEKAVVSAYADAVATGADPNFYLKYGEKIKKHAQNLEKMGHKDAIWNLVTTGRSDPAKAIIDIAKMSDLDHTGAQIDRSNTRSAKVNALKSVTTDTTKGSRPSINKTVPKATGMRRDAVSLADKVVKAADPADRTIMTINGVDQLSEIRRGVTAQQLSVYSDPVAKYRILNTPRRTLTTYPETKARDVVFQTYKDGGHGHHMYDMDAYLDQVDDVAQAQHARPPQSPTRKPTPVTGAKPPKAIKVVDRSIPTPKAPIPPSSGMKASSSRYHGIGPAAGLGALALTGLAIGAWALLKGDEQSIGAQMMDSPRHPREFMGMRPHGDFVASHKVGAWAQHQNMGVAAEEAASAHKREAMKHLGLTGVAMTAEPWLRPRKHALLEAWDHFHQSYSKIGPDTGRAAKRKVSKMAHQIRKGLKGMGYDQLAVQSFARRRKVQGAFINRIEAVAETKMGWYDKLLKKFSWESIKDSPDEIWSFISSKKSKLTKDAGGNVKSWFKNLNTKTAGWIHKVDINDERMLRKTGQKALVGRLARNKHTLAFDQFVDSLKWNYKHLVKNARGFQAKVTGAKDIITNFGHLEEMMVAGESGLMKSLKKKRQFKNAFTNVGERLKNINKNSPVFTKRFDKMRKLTKLGSKIGKFGRSGTGRLLGKIPYVNMLWGALEGYSMMDQYENATKGFITETAAGAARAATFALFRPGLWVAAGAKLGAAGATIGGPWGAAIGAVLGFVGAAALNLAVMFVGGELAASAVRYPTAAVLGARKRRNPDPTMSMDPAMLYQMGGIQGMRGPVNQFNRFHGMDPARPDMTPFGGAYNPIQGQDIDSKTLQITDSKRKITSSPRAGRPISMFTPTFGLVNNVLWNKRQGSRVRSVIERGAGMHSVPKLDRNRSRMAARAA